MISSHRTPLPMASVRFVMLALLGATGGGLDAFAQPATDAQVEGAARQSDLKWKPHRQATAQPAVTEAAPESQPSSQRDAVADSPALPAASVGLPERTAATPLRIKPRAPETAPYAPMRGSMAKGMQQMGEWFTRPASGSSRPATDSTGTTFAEKMMRTPQGQGGRPIMDRETGYGMNAPQQQPPLGGGLAPRYTPGTLATNGGSMPSQPRRSDRLAMNIDGIPSVMTRAPQAATIDDARTPGRLPADQPPAATLPAPAANRSAPSAQTVDPPIVIETTPMEMGMDGGMGMEFPDATSQGMWMGQYPAEMHVESFYDDPYACDEEGSLLPMHCCDGRICHWLRRFGKPYYGWKWYRDFTASAGVTAFQNESNLGLLGNYGTNEYLNWAMPFWNAFGVGWQVGARGVQSNFQRTTITGPGGTFQTNARDQVFVTTGFFTRAFEGRGLQGGAVYDYLHDSYFDNVNVSQLRAELGYVWGYHEFGFWGAFNLGDQTSLFGPVSRIPGQSSTEDLYTGYYRLHFGDANELRIWGGSTAYQTGIVGSSLRAPMSRSFALEGTFTYLIPGRTETYELTPGSTITASPSAWNVSLNVVYYPARRARRSLSSPYRPLFDVADNGSMIRTISR